VQAHGKRAPKDAKQREGHDPPALVAEPGESAPHNHQSRGQDTPRREVHPVFYQHIDDGDEARCWREQEEKPQHTEPRDPGRGGVLTGLAAKAPVQRQRATADGRQGNSGQDRAGIEVGRDGITPV
jgi:hypothetical protein